MRLLLVALLVIAGCHAGAAIASSPDMLTILERDILRESLAGKVVYFAPQPLKPGTPVTSWRTTHTAPAEYAHSWLFFVDDQPGANWEHAARLIFVEVDGKGSQVIPVRTPPDMVQEMKKVFPPERL